MNATQSTLFEINTQKPLLPLLKWAGGKRDLAPRLARMYEPYRKTHVWVEPFCGGLGAVLGVMPEKAILSDVNPYLINLYGHIKEGVKNTVDLKGWYWENTEERFYRIRSHFNFLGKNPYGLSSKGYEDLALHFYYLNRTCFRGLCRFSKKGSFNVPWGKYKKPVVDHNFSLYQKVFEGWLFWTNDYQETLNLIKNWNPSHKHCDIGVNHFIYADPPYDDGFVNYSGTFTWDDQVNLATQLSEMNCPVVASNKATERIIELYKSLGFDIEIISMARRISCDGNRDRVDEILASKNI